MFVYFTKFFFSLHVWPERKINPVEGDDRAPLKGGVRAIVRDLLFLYYFSRDLSFITSHMSFWGKPAQCENHCDLQSSERTLMISST